MARGEAFGKRPFLGRWRIVAMELWAPDDLDVIGQAHLTLERNGLGQMAFLAIEADLDYRVGRRDGSPALEFTFDGSDEGDRISGRGWAILEGDELQGRVFLHRGDGSAFIAQRSRHPSRRAVNA